MTLLGAMGERRPGKRSRERNADRARSPERDLRLADFLRDELARVLLSEVRDPRIRMTSVTDVRVKRDMSRADVYVSSLATGSDAERAALVAALDHAAGYLRSKVAQRSNLRTTPRLRFHYDELLRSGPRIDALIDHAIGGARAVPTGAATQPEAAGPTPPPRR